MKIGVQQLKCNLHMKAMCVYICVGWWIGWRVYVFPSRSPVLSEIDAEETHQGTDSDAVWKTQSLFVKFSNLCF